MTGDALKVEELPNGKTDGAGTPKAFANVGGSRIEPFNALNLCEALAAPQCPAGLHRLKSRPRPSGYSCNVPGMKTPTTQCLIRPPPRVPT